MKLDGSKTYEEEFDDDGENVWIWKEVLRKFKDAFLEYMGAIVITMI